MDKKSIDYSFNLQRITIRKIYGLGEWESGRVGEWESGSVETRRTEGINTDS
jgi:hypothetical protein